MLASTPAPSQGRYPRAVVFWGLGLRVVVMLSTHFQVSQEIHLQPTVYTTEEDQLVSFGICVPSAGIIEGSLIISHTEGYTIYFLDPSHGLWHF